MSDSNNGMLFFPNFKVKDFMNKKSTAQKSLWLWYRVLPFQSRLWTIYVTLGWINHMLHGCSLVYVKQACKEKALTLTQEMVQKNAYLWTNNIGGTSVILFRKTYNNHRLWDSTRCNCQMHIRCGVSPGGGGSKGQAQAAETSLHKTESAVYLLSLSVILWIVQT